VKTAETHHSNMMRKLGLHTIAEVVLCAVRNDIVHVKAQPYFIEQLKILPFVRVD
jgi:hypothetical protein